MEVKTFKEYLDEARRGTSETEETLKRFLRKSHGDIIKMLESNGANNPVLANVITNTTDSFYAFATVLYKDKDGNEFAVSLKTHEKTKDTVQFTIEQNFQIVHSDQFTVRGDLSKIDREINFKRITLSDTKGSRRSTGYDDRGPRGDWSID